jgi:hypothetical protein
MQKKGKFILLTLEEFKDWLTKQKFSRKIKLIQNHHTWLPNYHSFAGKNYFKLLTSMEAAHLERGFAEIAQNITTFPDGMIAICRDLNKIPAGIKGANAKGICIEHVGNFDDGGDQMSDAHKDTIVQLNALLCQKFMLVPSIDTVVYHHWYDLNSGLRTNGAGTVKTCPGTNFFGGNKTTDAIANFIPLIKKEIG